ncbi:MAG: hypothetical protein ABJ013_07940 [Halioglobus sp.]
MAPETMAVELIPLGKPELGMTRAEMLEHGSALAELASSGIDTFYTLLFAYIIAMYIAGRQLTTTQYVIANIMYLAVMATTIFFVVSSLIGDFSWSEFAGLSNGNSREFYLGVGGGFAMLVILSIWFGRKIRHPSPNLPV